MSANRYDNVALQDVKKTLLLNRKTVNENFKVENLHSVVLSFIEDLSSLWDNLNVSTKVEIKRAIMESDAYYISFWEPILKKDLIYG